MYRRNKRDRKGTAATEFALIIPVLLILTFGTIELSSGMYLRQTLKIASYEGARTAIRKRATTQDVKDVVDTFLQSRDITGATTIINRDPARTNVLIPITVTVRAPMNGNGILPHSFYTWMKGKTVRANTCMYKEFIHPDYEEELAGP